MPTCLFTGVELPPTTREEHTIPRSLGGRIRSRVVSSDAFNESCGRVLDEHLKAPYARMLNALAPLMTREHQPGLLEVLVPAEPPGLVLDQGMLTRRNMEVLEYDEVTGRPRSAVAADERPLRNLARQVGGTAQYSTVPATEGTTSFTGSYVIHWKLEVAALKSALLAFDHLLRDTDAPFTRHPALGEVRAFVRQTVAADRFDYGGCSRFCLGYQYDKLPLYRRLRQRLPHPETPFEHTLLVAGSAGSRCLNLVWLAFGFDPYGFRICHDWHGGDFAFGVVNGILSGDAASDAIPLPPPLELLCRPTPLRSTAPAPVSSDEQAHLAEQVSSRRRAAIQEAIFHAEMHADDMARRTFTEAARLADAVDRDVGTQIRQRIARLYRHLDDAAFLAAVVETVTRHGLAAPGLTADRLDPEPADWPAVLRLYRACLAELRGQYGLPGHLFVEYRTTELVPHGQAGELPPDPAAG